MCISWANNEFNTQLHSKGTTVFVTSGTVYPETRRQTSTYLNLHQNRYENLKSCNRIKFYTVLRLAIIPNIPGSNPRTVCLYRTFRTSLHSRHGYVTVSKEKSPAHRTQHSAIGGHLFEAIIIVISKDQTY